MISLITIHHNREKHLENLLLGVSKGFLLPDEIVIVNMGRMPDIEVPSILNVIWMDTEVKYDSSLPIGQARNLGADIANGDILLFLDVDCIPSPLYIEKIVRDCNSSGGVVMGTPKYLIKPVSNLFDFKILEDFSVDHPRRPQVKQLIACSDPGYFWSLCFALPREIFEKLGGFDDRFSGYGGEDTDLAYSMRELNVSFNLSTAIVYHQQHAFFKPPVNHIESIIHNCNEFYNKWGSWCMEKHLKAFDQLGLIHWNPDSKTPISIKNQLEPFVQDQYLVTDLPYA